MKRKTVKKITQSILDCRCKGNGVIFLKSGGYLNCPIHNECASNEDYRLNLLRLEYQNLRSFAIQMYSMEVIDLSLPTTASGVDEYIKENYDVESPESWVRAIQHYVREYLLKYKMGED